MTAEKFWNLLAKKLYGEAAVEELDELSVFLNANSSWKHKAEILTGLWQRSLALEDYESKNGIASHPIKREPAGVEIDTLYPQPEVEIYHNKKIVAKKWNWLSVAVSRYMFKFLN